MYPPIEEVKKATEWLDCLMVRTDISLGEDGYKHIVTLRKMIGEWKYIPEIEQKIKDECRGGINVSMHAEIERLKGELEEARGFCLKTDEVMVAFLQKYLKMPNATFEEICRKCEELSNATGSIPKEAQKGMGKEELAKFMHDTYEKLARENGWRTQECCQTPWETLPTANQEVMLELAQAILDKIGR
jgi:hypothetical protein